MASVQRTRPSRQMLESDWQARVIGFAELHGWRDRDDATQKLVRTLKNTALTDRGCWIFQGSRTTHGYGRVSVNHVVELTHRVVYEAAVGPIPDGFVIDHLCRNPPCCNPAHLEAVTQKVNIERGVSPMMIAHLVGMCTRGHSLAEFAHRRADGRVAYCRKCRNEQRRISRAELVAIDDRLCIQCGLSLRGLRSDAKFCGSQCSYDHRNAQRRVSADEGS